MGQGEDSVIAESGREAVRATLTFVALAALLLVALVAVALYSFRQFSIQSAEERARTVAEIVRVSLTEAMANGAIDRRAQLLARISRSAGLEDARVIRGDGVIRQFGQGFPAEHEIDDLDRAVLAAGAPRYLLVDGHGGVSLRAVIPYIAQHDGQPDCMQCHKVAPGDVLGAIDVRISLSQMRGEALTWVAVLVGITGAFAIVALYLLRRQYQPVAAVAASVENAVVKAAEGDFSTRLPEDGSGAAAHIAVGMNRLMETLGEAIGTIGLKVEQLMEFDLPRSRNMLVAALEMVEGLIDASRFKQSIEADETKEEVYVRLSRVFREKFDLSWFSIYEVSNSKNFIRAVMVDGLPGAEARWCDQEILLRADACRARRTGRLVDGIADAGICPMFCSHSAPEKVAHICLPMMQAGDAGCVIQLVAPLDAAPLLRALVPFLRAYLREAAPVIEAKRLMANLRESSFQDAMTGLYNRRFIEAYQETLQAAVKRKGGRLAVLMMDVDHFKAVNDTYGHDAGDKVLVAVAQALKKCLRGSDILIRYGGEEFLAFLPDTDGANAMIAAENVRAAVEALDIPLTDTLLKKTISIGVAEFPSDSAGFWEAVKFADAALYAAKENGRNRVVRFSPALWKQDEPIAMAA